MEFSRQEYCSGFPCPPPGDVPDPGFEAVSPVSPELAGNMWIYSDSERNTLHRVWAIAEGSMAFPYFLCAKSRRTIQ